MPDTIFTIGHSTLEIERFLALLRGQEIDVLADVRRYPGSRRNPQFGAEALARSLREAGIAYRAYGESLGGRRRARPDSLNVAWRSASFRGYADHMASAEFAAGIERLEQEARLRRVALMCAEAHPSRCHRLLVADALVARGWRVTHILSDGRAGDHALTAFAVVDGGEVTYPGPQASLLE